MTTGVINGVSIIDAVRDAMPDRYWLHISIGTDWGYVRAEPPARPGNRGPRLPRYVVSFGGNADAARTLDAALLDLLGELARSTTRRTGIGASQGAA